MLFVPVPYTIESAMIFQVGTQMAVNVFHFKSDNAAPTEMDCASVNTMLNAWYLAHYNPYQGQDVHYGGIHSKGMDSREASGSNLSPESPTVGQVISPILPMNVTVGIEQYTGLIGRSCRGRTYFVGLTESQVTGDGINAGVITQINDAFSALRTEASDASFPWVQVSKFYNGAARTTGVARTIIEVNCWSIVCSQKRRLSGRGS